MCNIAIFKDRVKALCKKNGITQKYLSELTGHGQYFLNDVWLGKRGISNDELIAIAQTLHTTPEYLKGETDDSKSEESTIIVINKSPVKRRLLDRIATMNDDDVQAIENLLNHFANGGKK